MLHAANSMMDVLLTDVLRKMISFLFQHFVVIAFIDVLFYCWRRILGFFLTFFGLFPADSRIGRKKLARI